MLSGPLLPQVKQVRTSLECAHHASCSLIEHPVGDMVKQMALELEVDDEIDKSPASNRREGPCVSEML